MTYRYRDSVYDIVVRNPDGVSKGVSSVVVDGARVDRVNLSTDGKSHSVEIVMGISRRT